MFRYKGPDLYAIVQCKPARSSSLCNVVFEGQLVIKDYTKFLTEVDGVIVEEPSWMVKSCCRVGVAGKNKKLSLLPGWAGGDVLSSMLRCLPGSLRSMRLPLDHLVEMRKSCVISIAMVAEAMCLYDGTQWCSVYGERGGVQELIPEERQWPVDVLLIPPLPRLPWKTYQWDRIQTSEVESLWCPVMRGRTGGSDGWQCKSSR